MEGERTSGNCSLLSAGQQCFQRFLLAFPLWSEEVPGLHRDSFTLRSLT